MSEAVVRSACTEGADEILRFRSSERLLHWAIAVPFFVCYMTALVLLVVYNPNPLLPFRAVFSWTHRIAGVFLAVLPVATLLTHLHDARIYLDNVKQAWRFRVDDVKWLALTGPATFSKRVTLPEQDKFNAGEKLNFMLLTFNYPLLIVTGAMMWLPGIAFASWMLHVSLAALATPFVLGHVFMATVNPDTRQGLSGMISGRVDRRWAKHHYGRWYRENFGEEESAATVDATPPVMAEILSELRTGGTRAPAAPPAARAADAPFEVLGGRAVPCGAEASPQP